MQIERLSRAALAAFTVAALAGCGASQLAPSAAVPASSFAAPAAAASYVYTCQNESGVLDCRVYAKNKPLRTITKGVTGPRGLVAGADGRLYVADAASGNVLVYAAGGKSLLQTISDAPNVPQDVAVYEDELAVANGKNLTFFAKGATKPTRTIKDPGMTQGNGVAFDGVGNCYLSVTTSAGARVDAFNGCKGKPHDLGISGGRPYGLAFDGQNNLYYTSYNASGLGVYKCAGTSSCALWNSQLIEPEYLNFSKGFADLWVDDTANYQSPAALAEIDATTGKVVAKITAGISFFDPPTGIAAGPGSL